MNDTLTQKDFDFEKMLGINPNAPYSEDNKGSDTIIALSPIDPLSIAQDEGVTIKELFIQREEAPLMAKKIKIETPMGSIESDSGNHLVDGISVVVIILVLYVGKKLVDRFFKG